MVEAEILTELDSTAKDRIRINVWLGRMMYDSLNDIAVRDKRSVSDLIREAARDLIIKDRKEGFGVTDGSST